MAEISREDAKDEMFFAIGNDRRISNKTLAKAISDMEKLNKIELVLSGWSNDNPTSNEHWEKMRLIERIVKGE